MADVGRIAAKIHHLGRRQHGHVTRAQLLALGLSSRAISRRIESGELVVVHAGVYAVGYVRTDPLARAAAAVLACGEDAVLSHASAAALWRNPRHPGAKRLRYVVGLDPTNSPFEDDFVTFAAMYGLPKPSMNAKVAGYTVDALFPEHKRIVELDSWAQHRDRSSFESDRERDAATLEADHVTIRLTWERRHRNPAREAERLHRILQRLTPVKSP